MIHATQLLAEFVYNLKFEDIKKSDIDYTKLLIMDYFAASYAGYRINTVFNNAVVKVIYDMGGREESTAFIDGRKLPAMNAAFVNATYAHGADMDDGHKRAMGHVGAHVISAVFALAETLEVTGKDVLTAIAAGYEVYVRTSAAAQPGLVHRGFHSTGTAGVIACAAACAKLLGLDEKGIYNAMAVSVTQASGLMIIAESGQMIKPVNPARAAQGGILSALLVKNGVEGGAFPLESEKGWFHAMTDKVDGNMITDGLGETLEVSQCYFKPYPSCRHTHAGIEAAIELCKGIDTTEIESVKLYTYKNAIKIAGQIVVPEKDGDSKFSIHYSLACAILRGHFNLSDLELENNEDIVEFTKKIELIEDSEMEIKEKGIRGARLELIMKDKKALSKTVLVPKGDPESPFTIDDMREKLKGCIPENAEKKLIDKVIDYVNNMENQDKFRYYI